MFPLEISQNSQFAYHLKHNQRSRTIHPCGFFRHFSVGESHLLRLEESLHVIACCTGTLLAYARPARRRLPFSSTSEPCECNPSDFWTDSHRHLVEIVCAFAIFFGSSLLLTMNRAEAQVASLNGSVRKRTAAPSPSSERKHKSMEEIMRAAKPASPITEDYYSDVLCQQCRLGEDEDKIILCDRCDLGFHLYCLRPIVPRVPTGPWFCPSCKDEKTVRRFPLMQKSIVNFFRIRKCTNELPKEICGPWNGGRKRRRRSIFLCSQKKRRRLVPFSPSKDPSQRLLQMGSLATALTSLKMEFSNDLTYFPGMASRSANTAILEKGGMQVLAREDKETLELCKTMYSRGECPPLVVIFDPCEGFTVHTDDDIKDMTFISEYTGDVDYLKKREHDDCDSMMTLLLATNSCNSLVICPDKRGNIARFISGINNHTPEGMKKQNIKCVRYDVDGQCRVLLVACRDISRGERLYYDYNGYEQEYPTQYFL